MSDLAALVRHPRWWWMPGMLDSSGLRILSAHEGRAVYVHDHGVPGAERPAFGWIAVEGLRAPIPSDPATFGCLCALAAELHNAPDSYVALSNITGWTYFVIGAYNEQGAVVTKMFHGDSREDAACKAILGAP